jgi:long-chain acyl-CoA synthetase
LVIIAKPNSNFMKGNEVLESFVESPIGTVSPAVIVELVDSLVKEGGIKDYQHGFWYEYLNKTGHPDFLSAIEDYETRAQWAESVFKIIQHTEYSLKDLFDERVKEMPQHILFQDMSTSPPSFWTYEQMNRQIRQFAAVFHKTVPADPRVAIFSDNCVSSATTDLACLFYDIFDSPLSTHFKINTLVTIFDSVEINIAVCETQERLETLKAVRKKTKRHFVIYTLSDNIKINGNDIQFIGNATTVLDTKEVESILSKRKIKPIAEVATTMFTSGSTGIPKGVSFSIYNLVSKRFARHAALPKVGRKEVLLCFLPLFHTFGRYLEMLGMIYWRGTYTFAGNTSSETLFTLMPKVNPSGFISVPIRWLQLYDKIEEHLSKSNNDKNKEKIIKKVLGNRLSWGLSAAGYLSPKVFNFFQNNGVALCSGFGMTEATGGITMTPPGEYRKNSTGIMLPGIYGKLEETGELKLSGHYLAWYLDDKAPGDIIPYPENEESDYWMNTGDIFRLSDDGFYEIVDRVKDIYKNNKGQTIAPKTIEQKFTGVPGIKQTFLVGDARPYNVLLIVPDFEDPLLQDAVSKGDKDEYFHQIVMLANKDVARYERVINFSILENEFSADKGELTPKGSFNRKAIENNFKELIDSLYKTNHVRLRYKDLIIVIPRWFYRDLGILETDIILTNDGVENRRTNKSLIVQKLEDKKFLIGDLIYNSTVDVIDFGRIARQPKLWIGNPEFIEFAPVKEGWDLPLKNMTSHVSRLKKLKRSYHQHEIPLLNEIKDQNLQFINNLICSALFCPCEVALNSTRQLGQMFNTSDDRIAGVIRRRLEALSCHEKEEVRVLAYRMLLLEDPNPDFAKTFPAFIQSGLSFLTEESINQIALSNFGKQHLDSLRKRMHYYRSQLKWPATENVLEQFKNILKLLFNFASNNLSHYISIRSEMASWILHKVEPELSKLAEHYFFELYRLFDEGLKAKTPKYTEQDFEYRIVYETGISQAEIEKLNQLFTETLFLDQSIILAFEELDFNLFQIPKNGIWISRLMAFNNYNHYRLSINTIQGKHFELHMVVSKQMRPEPNYEALYWLSSLSGHPIGPTTLPTLGCSRMSYGIRTTKFLGELTGWVKIRENSEIDNYTAGYIAPNSWRKLFIKSFSIFFMAWRNSNYRIVPGAISPNNIVVPTMDFRTTASIVTLSGMKDYENTLSLVEPMVKEFYNKTAAHYPWVKKQLELEWIFDACFEAFSKTEAIDFLLKLKTDLEKTPVFYEEDHSLLEELEKYLTYTNRFYLPLPLFNAIDRYAEWGQRTPTASAEAKEQTIFELFELYKLHRYPQVVRYYLFRKTYFKNATQNIKAIFDELLNRMRDNSAILPMQLIELSDLQGLMVTKDDKMMFSKMVFPKKQEEQKIDILKVKADNTEQVIVRSQLVDKYGEVYNFREPLEPSEVGQLYHLFYKVHYPKTISKMDKHFVVTDENDRVIGGLCFKELEDNVVLLDGSAITSSLQGRGIGSAMVEDFFTRMASTGVQVVKAHFLLGNYYLKHNFQVDKKWGALVRYL